MTKAVTTARAGRAMLAMLAVIGLMWAASAHAAAPNFGPAIYADGEVWGTTGLAPLPEPNGHNEQSFDPLYIFTNGATGQLPVAEAAPGNPLFNGGRWETVAVTWLAAGMDYYGGVLPVLMSSEQVLDEADAGHLELGGHPAGPPPYFECPLLPSMVPAGQ